MRAWALFMLLLASQMSPNPCMPTPVVAKIGPEGRAGSVPPAAQVDAFGLEQYTAHPNIPRKGNRCGSPQSDFYGLFFFGHDHGIVVINEEFPSA